MIYILYSGTGKYEDYVERAHYYFTSKKDADKVLEKLLEFDEYIHNRFKHLDWWSYRRVYEAAYEKIGLSAYVDGGLNWFIRTVKCGDELECLK